MRFEELGLSGAYLIHLDPKEDERGSFTRTFDKRIFEDAGIHTSFPEQSMAYNHKKGTLRGMHYQKYPFAEAKLVRCTRGKVYDVVIDLREDSPTYLQHVGIYLSDNIPQQLYIPEGMAHGYITMEDNSTLEYMISSPFVAEAQGGLRFDDPKLNIRWPLAAKIISERDLSFPLL